MQRVTYHYLISLLVLTALFGASFTTLANTEATESLEYPAFKVEIYGDDQPILFIPGLASSGDVWNSAVEALKDQYQLHVFTLAGFAGVEPLTASVLENGFLAAQENALRRYIADKGLDGAVVVGHSLGGFIGMRLALNFPDSISGVVNVDGLPALGALFAKVGQEEQAAAQQNFDPHSMAQGMSNNEAWHERIAADMIASHGMTSGRVMGELMMADLRDSLKNLHVPTLSLGALQNGAPYTSKAQVQTNYEAQFAQAPEAFHRLEFAENSRHFIMADDPEWLIEKIATFVQSLPTKLSPE